MNQYSGSNPHREYTVTRKLHRQGGSLLVAIPKIWLDAERLKKGDNVTVVFDGNITILPQGNGTQQRSSE